MYDAYKITRITLHVEYLNNTAFAVSQGLMPTMYQYWDQDDATVPDDISKMTGKQGVKIRHFNGQKGMRFSFTPIPSVAAADFAPGTEAAIQAVIIPNKSQWINCTYPEVPHYGFKAFLTDVLSTEGTPAATVAFRFNWTYHVCFRAPLLTT